MNYIIKSVVKKVFQQYLNLQNSIDLESGVIKLPQGSLNQERINQKLQVFGLEIISSLYKNLSISIPLTQIVSKPIKINIQKFNVLIKKQIQGNTIQRKEVEEEDKIEQQKMKYQSQKKQQQQQFQKQQFKNKEDVGYVKNMVNRLLYNMEIHIQNVSLTLVQEGKNSIHFQVNGFHIKNSLVLLEADIIKKIFNLQTLKIIHLYGQFIIKDLNLCLDYNNKKLGIIAILNSLNFQLCKIPLQKIKELEKLGKKSKKKQTLILEKQQKMKKQSYYKKKKALDVSFYLKIVQLKLKTQIICLVGQNTEIKYKCIQISSHKKNQKVIQIQLSFKRLALVNKEEKNILKLKHLPYSKQVKIYSQYQDNILKSSLIKFSIIDSFDLNSDQSQIKFATRHIKGQVYYVCLIIQLDNISLLLDQIVSYSQYVKTILNFILKNIKKNEQDKKDFQAKEQPKLQQVKNYLDFVVYRIMAIVNYQNINLKIYGSINLQYGDIKNNFQMQERNINQTYMNSYNVSNLQKKYSSSSSIQSNGNQKLSQKAKNSSKNKFKQNKELVCVGYFGILQLCCEINNYLILDLYNFQTKINSFKNNYREIILIGTELISQLSIQLILTLKKQVLDLIKAVQSHIINLKQITNEQQQSHTFRTKSKISQEKVFKNQQRENQKQTLIKDISESEIMKNSKDILLFQTLNKIGQAIFLPCQKQNQKNLKDNKIASFFKFNEISIKFGNLFNLNKFFCIMEGKLSNIQFCYKSDKIKLNCQFNGFISSPHTLHRSPLSNQFGVQLKYYLSNEEFLINIKNNIVLCFQEKYIQILSKYIQSEIKIEKNQQKKHRNQEDYKQKKISCQNQQVLKKSKRDQEYLCTLYNLTQNLLSFIQFNQDSQENSFDSLQLQNLNDQQSSTYLRQQTTIKIQKKCKQNVFFLQDNNFFVKIDQIQELSKPIYIDSIKGQISQDSQYPYHFQTIVQFDDDELDEKYAIYILLNQQLKIQKIFFKYTSLVVSYKNKFLISLKDKQIQAIPVSKLQLLKFQNWIQFYKRVELFYDNLSLSKQSIKKKTQCQILLDLDEETSKFEVYLDNKKSQKLKIKNFMKTDDYSLYGIYKEIQGQKIDNQNKKKSMNKLFQCYMYEKKCLKSTYFVIMPFLIIKNNLKCKIQLQLINKKTQQKASYYLVQQETLQMKPELFDFYNKQFTLKVKLISQSTQLNHLQKQKRNFIMESHQRVCNQFSQESFNNLNRQKQQEIIKQKKIYESQQHYFNTFFMVEHNFQTCIQLRSNMKHIYDRKNITLKEQLILKTKVLIIDNPLKIINRTQFNFGVKIKQSSNINHQKFKNQTSIKDSYILSNSQLSNQHLYLQKYSETNYLIHLKQSDILQILFENMSENKIEVKCNLFLNGHTVLSFNFVKLNEQFCHILFRGKIKSSPSGQSLIIQDYINFTNISKTNIQFYGINVLKDQTKCFPLPATANNKFNNKVLNLSLAQLQNAFNQLFYDQTQKLFQKSIKIKIDHIQVDFQALLKLTLKQINLKNQFHVFSLLKDLKNGINFYLSDNIFNPNINYTIFNNLTKKSFLLTNDNQYTHHFKFKTNQHLKQKKIQKVLIHKQSFNVLLNKQNHQLLLCDQNAKHLQKTTKNALKKEGIKIQCYNIDKFNIIDAFMDEEESFRQSNIKANAQIFTKAVQIQIKLYNKLFLSTSLKSMSFRLLEQNKLDFLIQDLMIKDNISKQYILRIPQETFFLFQTKRFNQNFILIKNLFIKCKNIIVNVNKELPYTIITLSKNISNADLQSQINKQKHKKKQTSQSLTKIYSYLNEKLFLIKNICIHQVHLSISLDLQDLNFSNVVILPQFELKNKFLRQKNLLNQLNQFYMTNLVGKLPKLSFIMQNLRSPINTIRTLIKVGSAINDKIFEKPLLSFYHSQIPEDQKVFSIQRWAIIHKAILSEGQQLIVQMKKNKTYYIVSNLNLIILYSNKDAKDIESSSANVNSIKSDEESQIIEASNFKNIIRMSNGVYIKKISLKDLQKLRLIKNKKNSQIMMKFKKNIIISLCDQSKKCQKFTNVINRLVL